jgi:ribosomal protein S18 acetylase RimI-like enzyme
MKITIREMEKMEFPLLGEFLFEAIFIPPGEEKPQRDILQFPELSCYFNDFGKASDHCLVAERQGMPVGAVWTRIFSETEKGFGYVDQETPELSMSVLREYRQQGIGGKLMEAMLSKLQSMGYRQVSLSVDKLNYASDWYPKFGFEEVAGDEHSVVMVKRLNG